MIKGRKKKREREKDYYAGRDFKGKRRRREWAKEEDVKRTKDR